MFFTSKFCFLTVLFIYGVNFCFAIDTISPAQLITDKEYVTSLGEFYRLGFFSPGNSSNRYVGIWYNRPTVERAVVWVANRQQPLTDSSGVLRINSDGNLVVLDGKQNAVWTTNVSVAANSLIAELLDSGNLLLRKVNLNGTKGRIIWQSFDHPSDTFSQDMRLVTNTRTGEKKVITSWKSNTDPSEGKFRMELEPLSVSQLIIWNGSQRHWRTGPWDGSIFIGVEDMEANYLNGFKLNPDDPGGNVYVSFSYNLITVKYVLNPNGQLRQLGYDKETNKWKGDWAEPKSACQFYGKCGLYGVCNKLSSPVCSCLRGYQPKSAEEWSDGNWSSGCTRKTQLQCEGNNTDGFLKYENMKVPDFADWIPVLESEECKQICLRNCSCVAYSFASGVGCMSWHGKLLDMQKFSVTGVDLYIRAAYSELDIQKNKNKTMILIIISILAGLLTASLCMYIYWRSIKKQKGERNMELILLGIGDNSKELSDSKQLNEPDVPMIKYETLAVATVNFGLENKHGEGGFGSVYKGKLPSGEEIAVKRLSKSSAQGSEEFRNEVAVISRLQHRNLVRLLGFCIGREEKMLIYEYMPNKSLDVFLSDPTRKALLGWRKCFEIIEGIGRGILYLHRDSRLRVIHRDLKPSNILLDTDLNPKIADFGIAKIVAGNELQANTRRVVGTYGYMSPEYAMDGRFSEKSDVYSFGVLVLEIVTGMRNTGFYRHEESSMNLMEHVWKSWNKDSAQEIIDPSIFEPIFVNEILRCIQVGLLCVQEFAKDRPNMSSIISMLTSEITILPTPEQPAFTERKLTSDSESSNCSEKHCSTNEVTITVVGGR